MDKIYRIYSLTNTVNGKKYIGQTTRTMNSRWCSHRWCAKTNKPLLISQAIREFGEGAFTTEIIEECTDRETADCAEAYWIAKLKTTDPLGYNIRPGGLKSPQAESSKIKMRNKVISPQTRIRISLARKGRKITESQLKGLAEGRKLRWSEKQKGSGTGEKNPNAKLSERDVIEIRRLYSTGHYSQEKIGAMFGVKQITVSLIVRGKCWRHILPEDY